MIKGHGGNIYELARRLGCHPSEITDMSSNVNPIGPPPGLISFLRKNLGLITALPEVDAEGIRRAFADNHGLDPARVIAGNGTTQLIYSLPRLLATRKALIVGPTYADYGDACAMNKIEHDYFIASPETGFVPDLTTLSRTIRFQNADTVFICNPNNPTGVLIPPADIRELCAGHPRTRFIIDEAYLPFIQSGESLSLIKDYDQDNLIVFNSMSKIFRIPGLRIGFAVAPPDLVDRLAAGRLPWSVNVLSQAAVTWLMSHPDQIADFIRKTVALLDREREYLTARLSVVSVLQLFPSTTSFMLMALSGSHTAASVCDYLGRHRLLIRNCANFKGLSSRYIRISLKTRKDNRRLIDLLTSPPHHSCESRNPDKIDFF